MLDLTKKANSEAEIQLARHVVGLQDDGYAYLLVRKEEGRLPKIVRWSVLKNRILEEKKEYLRRFPGSMVYECEIREFIRDYFL